MKKHLALAVLAVGIPSAAVAGPNVGSCGLGSKLMEGNQGIAPQVLAITTNGTSGNQTFGITSGTSGCTQDGVVTSNWKTAMFIDSNMNKLARDMSVGGGESLESLAVLLGVEGADKELFFTATQKNFDRIFSSEDVSSEEVMGSLKLVLAGEPGLSAYAERL